MSQPPYYPQPHYPQAPPPTPKGGLSVIVIVLLVVLGGVVVVGGILGVLAIYGTRKYIATAKQVEARSSLAEIGSLAKLAYARDGKICPSASQPIPSTVPSGVKFQSASSDWEADKASNAGFACLGFAMATPQYFQYEYKATAVGFTATARGDLDGDGVASVLELEGKVVGADLVVAPTLKETNPGE